MPPSPTLAAGMSETRRPAWAQKSPPQLVLGGSWCLISSGHGASMVLLMSNKRFHSQAALRATSKKVIREAKANRSAKLGTKYRRQQKSPATAANGHRSRRRSALQVRSGPVAPPRLSGTSPIGQPYLPPVIRTRGRDLVGVGCGRRWIDTAGLLSSRAGNPWASRSAAAAAVPSCDEGSATTLGGRAQAGTQSML